MLSRDHEFAPYSWRGRCARGLLRKRGQVLLDLDAQGRADLAIIRTTRSLTPLLLSDASALSILAHARAAATIGGAFAEAGVFMGGSARLICEAKGIAPLHLFDVFESLQADREVAIEADGAAVARHFGALHGRIDEVRALLAPYSGVALHAGVFPASASALDAERFAFVHLDLDLYEGTRAALAFFWPRMLHGGVLLGDDYNLPGVRRAFADHFAQAPQVLTALPWSQVVAVKATEAIKPRL